MWEKKVRNSFGVTDFGENSRTPTFRTINPFRTAVSFWGHFGEKILGSLSGLSPKRDCSSKGVNSPATLSNKVVVHDQGEIWWRRYGGPRRRSISVSLPISCARRRKINNYLYFQYEIIKLKRRSIYLFVAHHEI